MALWTPANSVVQPRLMFRHSDAVWTGSNLTSIINAGTVGGSFTVYNTPTKGALLNSQQTIKFDTSGQSLGRTWDVANTGKMSVFYYGKFLGAAGSGANGLLNKAWIDGTQLNCVAMYIDTGAGQAEWYGNVDALSFTFDPPDLHLTANPHTLNVADPGYAQLGTTLDWWLAGTQLAIDTGTSVAAAVPDHGSYEWIIGSGFNPNIFPNEPVNMDLLCVAVFDDWLSTGERQQWEGYFAHLGGTQTQLPIGHPYRSAAPTTTTAYSLTAAAGAYVITGVAAGLKRGKMIGGAAGSYAISGQAATLRKTNVVVGLAGTYVITGQTATVLRYGRAPLTAAAGSYAIAGQDAGLRSARPLVAAAGSYALTGQDAGLRYDRAALAAGAGAYVISGQDAGLSFGHKLIGEAGAYTITGMTASLTYGAGVALSADAGVYVVTGIDATLQHMSKLLAAAGVYVLNGQDAALRMGRVPLAADAGAYAISGQTASLLHNGALAAGTGSYTVTGVAAALVKSWVVGAAAGSYAVTGVAAELVRGLKVGADAGSYGLSGQDVILRHSGVAIAAAGSYIVTGQDATLEYDRSVLTLTADAGAYTIVGNPAGLAAGRVMAAAAGSYAITGQDAGLSYPKSLGALAGIYTLTGQDAGLTRPSRRLFAFAGRYDIVGYATRMPPPPVTRKQLVRNGVVWRGRA